MEINALQQNWQDFSASVHRQNQVNGDLMKERVQQQELLRTSEAQVKSIQAEDEMLGTLFDALA